MVEIMRAHLEDASEITRIKTLAFNKEINTYLGRDGGPPGYDSVESEISIIENCIAYKVLLGNKIIGAFFLTRHGDRCMNFDDFVIDPIYQGRGFGYKVLCMTEKMYPDIEKWRLCTPIFSIGNQHLYEKFGYKEVSRNRDEIFYEKNVGAGESKRV